jgi:putative flavoprotein involved in K+ transport
LIANGPAWHDRFPGLAFPNAHPDGFPDKETVADYFEAYARKIAAPIRCGVDVRKVERQRGRDGFLIETSHGMFEANSVGAATGPFQCTRVPAIVPDTSGVPQLHSVAYRNPDQLPKGSVLIVGAGSSGVQIAEELPLAGRRVYLSVGPHEHPPRASRSEP